MSIVLKKLRSFFFDDKDFTLYIQSLPGDYFRETIHCDGRIKASQYPTLDLYSKAIKKYIFEYMNIELEQELYKEAMEKEIDRSECMMLMSQLLRSDEFMFHLKFDYNLEVL